LYEFVKHGEESALIEIELKNHPSNTIITRTFGKQRNSTKWSLNGRSSTESAVKSIVAGLNIQVDNLCQFLPQDKVASFAKMNTKELLRETQRAAGLNLLEMHDGIIAKQTEFISLEKETEDLKSKLKVLQDKNALIEKDVQRVEEREEVELEIKKLEIKLVIANYQKDLQKYLDMKAQVQAQKQENDVLEKKKTPINADIAMCGQKINEKTEELDENKKRHGAAIAMLRDFMDQLSKGDDDFQTDMNKVKSAKKLMEQFDLSTSKLENELHLAQNALADKKNKLLQKGMMTETGAMINGPEHELINDRMMQLAQDIQEANQLRMKLEQALDDVKVEAEKLRIRRDQNEASQRNLTDSRAQVLRTLERMDSNVTRAVHWLRQNGNLFSQHVFEPVCMEITVRDAKYAAAAESLISVGDLLSFVTLNKRDYVTLKENTLDKGIRINVVQIDYHPGKIFTPSISKEKIISLGCDGYLSDLIDGPDEILFYLKNNARIHTKPIALRRLESQALKFLEADVGGTFVVASSRYTVKKAYGQSAVGVTSIGDARFLSKSVDKQLKNNLAEEAKEISRSIGQSERRMEESHARLQKQANNLAALNDDKRTLKEQKAALDRLVHEYRSASQLAEFTAKKLQDHLNQDDPNEQYENAKRRATHNARNRIKSIGQLVKIEEKATKIFEQRTLIWLNMIEYQAKVELNEGRLNQINEQLNIAKVKLDGCNGV
jgi:chromosome segregation ATPase